MRAYRVSERAAGVGFDWSDIKGVIEKVEEEWGKFKDEIESKPSSGDNYHNKSIEFGDVLFTLINVARFAGIHPETALSESTNKFEKRFKHMEKIVSEQDRAIESASRREMDRLWETAKKKISN